MQAIRWSTHQNWLCQPRLLHSEALMITKSLILAMIMVESGGNPRAVSPAGAKGLMQLTTIGVQEVSNQYGLSNTPDLWNPETNIQYGALLLGFYYRDAKSLWVAVGRYNAGYQQPWPAETVNYVKQVMAWRWELDPTFYRILPERPRPYEEIVDEILERESLF